MWRDIHWKHRQEKLRSSFCWRVAVTEHIGVPHKHFSFHGLCSYAGTYSLKQTVSNHNEQTALSRVYSKIDSSNKALLIRHLLIFPVSVELKHCEWKMHNDLVFMKSAFHRQITWICLQTILFSCIITAAVGCTPERSKFHSGQWQNIIPPHFAVFRAELRPISLLSNRYREQCGRDVWNWPITPSNAEIMNAWITYSASPYVSILRSLE